MSKFFVNVYYQQAEGFVDIMGRPSAYHQYSACKDLDRAQHTL